MISAQQAQFYARHGFVVVDNILDAEKIREAIGAIDELLDPSNLGKAFEMEPQDGSTVRRIWSPTQKHDVFERPAADPALLDCIQQLIGDNVLFHYSKINMKGPKVGSIVKVASGFFLLPAHELGYITALIFLDDATRENGCLRVIPGSSPRTPVARHRWLFPRHRVGRRRIGSR